MGVLLRFSNEGEQVYDDPLPNGTLKLVGGGSGKQASLIPLGGKNPCKNPTVKLKQGQSKNVCIAFEMPKKRAARFVRVHHRRRLRRHRPLDPLKPARAPAEWRARGAQASRSWRRGRSRRA